MSILTLPNSVLKNTLMDFTLNKTELIASAKVQAADDYLKDPSNWRKIIVLYTSTESNQFSIVSFPVTEDDNLIGKGYFAAEARNNFRIQRITIHDKQNGTLPILRDELTDPEDFDLVFALNETRPIFFGYGDYYSYGEDVMVDSADRVFLSISGSSRKINTKSYSSVVYRNGVIEQNITDILNATSAATYAISEDESTIYICSSFGGRFGDTIIETHPENADSGFSIIAVDVATKAVSVIAHLQYNSSPYQQNFNSLYSIAVDDNAIYVRGSGVHAYDKVTGALLWYIYSNAPQAVGSGYITQPDSYKMTLTSDAIYMYVVDSGSINKLAKYSKIDGSIDSSFDGSFPNSFTGGSHKYAISPDKTKIVMSSGNEGYGIFVWDLVGNTKAYYALDLSIKTLAVTNTEIFIYASIVNSPPYNVTGTGVTVFNYQGQYLRTAITTIPTPQQYTYAQMAITTDYIMLIDNGNKVLTYNRTSGATVTTPSLYIEYPPMFKSVNDLVVMSSGFTSNGWANNYPFILGGVSTPANSSVLVGINKETGGIIEQYGYDNFAAETRDALMWSSPLMPDKVILCNGQGFKVIDVSTAPWTDVTNSVGFPVWNGQGNGNSIIGGEVHGNYLYLLLNSNVNASFTDHIGVHNQTSRFIRIDLTTMAVDRSWSVTDPVTGAIHYGGRIDAVGDYVYYVSYPTFDYETEARIFKIHKTSGAISEVTAATLGVTSLGQWSYSFKDIGNGRMVVFKSRAKYNQSASMDSRLASKTYAVYDIDTFANRTQPSHVDAPYLLRYNPYDNCLYGFASLTNTTQLHMVKYDPTNSGREVLSDNLMVSPNYRDTTNMKHWNDIAFASNGDSYATYKGVIDQKFMNGLLRMNPFATFKTIG